MIFFLLYEYIDDITNNMPIQKNIPYGNTLIIFVIIPLLIMWVSIIYWLLTLSILVNIFKINVNSSTVTTIIPAWIALFWIGYTFILWYKNKEITKQKADLHNFALLEPIAFYESPFVNNNYEITEKKNMVTVQSSWKIYELFKILVYPWYYKYIDKPFESNSIKEWTPLISLVNRWKDHWVVQYVYILFRKKLDTNLDKSVYIKDNNSDYTIIEKWHKWYVFPYQDIPFISMNPSVKYNSFYNHIKSNKSSFVVVLSYRSVINDKNILQAYKAQIWESSYWPYIRSFKPMEEEDIVKDIEPKFAKQIINNWVYLSQNQK